MIYTKGDNKGAPFVVRIVPISSDHANAASMAQQSVAQSPQRTPMFILSDGALTVCGYSGTGSCDARGGGSRLIYPLTIRLRQPRYADHSNGYRTITRISYSVDCHQWPYHEHCGLRGSFDFLRGSGSSCLCKGANMCWSALWHVEPPDFTVHATDYRRGFEPGLQRQEPGRGHSAGLCTEVVNFEQSYSDRRFDRNCDRQGTRWSDQRSCGDCDPANSKYQCPSDGWRCRSIRYGRSINCGLSRW